MAAKKVYNYKDCLEHGFLRKIPPSKDKAFGSLAKAEKWLEEAEKTLQGTAFNSSVLDSYMAMFHSARAVLFFDGYREKSHVCVARYLEEKYVKAGKLEDKWVHLLDHHREIRHNDQYSLSFFSTAEEARKALDSASKFFKRLKLLLENLSKLQKGR